MASTVVLITGGNRGLGNGLVKLFLAQPNHTVIATVRDPSHPTAQALADLPKAAGSSIIALKYDAGSENGAAEAIAHLKAEHSVDRLDIVIANAGISKVWPSVKDVKWSEIVEHVEVNVLGVVALYQATRELLQKSTGKPVFAPVGSGAGSLGRQPPVPNAAYGPSKTMLNWYAVRINAEEDWLNAFILDPGWVQTDMGNEAARIWGMGEAPDTLEDSVGGMFKVITTATKEAVGGKIVSHKGEVLTW